MHIYRKWMGVNSVAHRIKDIPSHGLRALFQGFENIDYGLWSTLNANCLGRIFLWASVLISSEIHDNGS